MSQDNDEALLRRPALRLGPAFRILDVGETTGFKWINQGILDRFYVGNVPYVTTASIRRAMRAEQEA